MSKNLKLKKNDTFEDPRTEFRMKRINYIIGLIRSTQDKIGLLSLKKNEYVRTKDLGEQKKINSEMNKISKSVS